MTEVGHENPYAVRSFEEFWPHYVLLHTRRETHAFHAAGSLTCVGLLAAAVVLRQPVLAVVGPIVDYALAQASHRLFESNRTMPWKNQVWHTRAEMRMLRLVLTGKMAAEVTRRAARL
ncbi:MAG TPA: DUF962 domain-containing protein [Polyangiaceae bacterium]